MGGRRTVLSVVGGVGGALWVGLGVWGSIGLKVGVEVGVVERVGIYLLDWVGGRGGGGMGVMGSGV